MTMKSGTGDDLWGDDPDDDDEPEAEPEPEESRETVELEGIPDEKAGRDERREEREPATSSSQTDDLPYVARRAIQNESVTWNRDRLTFFVREHVAAGERDLISDAESALDRDIPKFDIREAAYLVAQRHPNEVVEELRRMGYDME